MINFVCNICGQGNSLPDHQKHREMLVCTGCGSNARFRGYTLALQRCFIDSYTPLDSAKERKGITGIGFSDAPQYAKHLERIFSYRNTFLHIEPILDITSDESVNRFVPQDFVICGDVLEHVTSVTSALTNLRKLVKPTGVLILSVPYLEGYDTIEHYPHLYDWQIISLKSGRYAVINETETGQVEVFRDPIFHGGAGTVLEFRIFGEGDLLARLSMAGFTTEVIEPTLVEVGYVWDYTNEQPHWHGRRHKSCVMICR